jgi:hypothetical protein
MRNASKPRPMPWKKWSPADHENDNMPVIFIASGEPSRDRYDFEYHLPEQIRDYLAGYTDVDPATVDMDALVEEILDHQITRPYGQDVRLNRALLLHYVAKHRTPTCSVCPHPQATHYDKEGCADPACSCAMQPRDFGVIR